MGKVVTAAVVVVRGEDKLQRYYYQGSTLPAELPKDEVQRLVDAGMVGDDDALVAQPGDEPGGDASRADGRPKANSSKDEWVTYAVAQRGEDTSEEDARREAESMTKADLVARHGGSKG